MFDELRDGGVSAVKAALKAAIDDLGERIIVHHNAGGGDGGGGGRTSGTAWDSLVGTRNRLRLGLKNVFNHNNMAYQCLTLS